MILVISTTNRATITSLFAKTVIPARKETKGCKLDQTRSPLHYNHLIRWVFTTADARTVT